jgi:hypothetical protein
MIYAVETITGRCREGFDEYLWASIARFQEQGLEVEVQYQPIPPGSATVRMYSALVIARKADTLPPPKEEVLCQCWNEGQYGRVHREDCPVHKDGAR